MRLPRHLAASASASQRAFTLLELMLALVVASFVLLAINGIFFGALKLRTRTTAALDRALPIERALTLLQRDLAAIVPPGGTLGGSLQSSGSGIASFASSSSTNTSSTQPSASASSSADLQALAELGQIGPAFRTASALPDDLSPWSEIQQVAYLLLDPTNRSTAGRDLVRSVTRNLLPASAYHQPDHQWLLGGVEDLRFLFHDGTQWREFWDSPTEETPLPRAIKVELQLAADDPRHPLPPLIELVVPLLVDGATNQTTTTSSSDDSSSDDSNDSGSDPNAGGGGGGGAGGGRGGAGGERL